MERLWGRLDFRTFELVNWSSSPFLLFFLDCLSSRRFRLPDGLLLLPWPMVIDLCEKVTSDYRL
jgi:hypothetical protein